MAESTLDQIFSFPVGDVSEGNQKYDLLRLQYLLRRLPVRFLSSSLRDAVSASGKWDSATEAAVADYLGQSASAKQQFGPLSKSKRTLLLARRARVATKLPASTGLAAVISVHNACKSIVGVNSWNPNEDTHFASAIGVARGHAIFSSYHPKVSRFYPAPVSQPRGGESAAYGMLRSVTQCSCNVYTNLLVQSYLKPMAGGKGFKASLRGIVPSGNALGASHGMSKAGVLSLTDLKKYLSANPGKSRRFYCVDVIKTSGGAHSVAFVRSRGQTTWTSWDVYHCATGGVQTQSLKSFVVNQSSSTFQLFY